MKLKKNKFVLYYNPVKYQSFELCLVEKDSLDSDPTVKVIKFSRVNHNMKFEPWSEDEIPKSKIFMVNPRFTMSTFICPMMNEEKCVVEYNHSEILLTAQIKKSIAKLEKRLTKQSAKQRKHLKILGKKSHLQISKKMKTQQNQISEISLKKSKECKISKQSKFRKGKENPLITSVVDHSTQMQSPDNNFDISCCVKCNNKELVRAVKTQNRTLFDSILKSTSKISSVRVNEGCAMLEYTLTLALETDEYFFQKLMTLQYGTKSVQSQRFYTQEATPR